MRYFTAEVVNLGMKKTMLLLVLSAGLLLGCSSKKVDTVNPEQLSTIMTGHFTSKEQSEQDPEYYNISLHVSPIWKNQDGQWLYVEQALTSTQNKPYRQRIYHIQKVNDSILKSTIYTIPEQADWVGKWDTPESFDSISPDQLEIREGCDVFLKKVSDKKYVGSTQGKNCSSSLNGASYATSIVEISSDQMISWDRGFDASGNHVWGAEKAGYVFKRVSN